MHLFQHFQGVFFSGLGDLVEGVEQFFHITLKTYVKQNLS